MCSKEEKQKMRKNNMRIFPTYKKLAWDYLFYYAIDFLFLTQIKHISAANVVLKSTFYSLFGIIMKIPANIVVEFIGRKNSLILANILNCFYIVMIMISRNLGDLIFAELMSAIAFSIKNIAEPSLLNESIPPSKHKSKIFSKISSKGASGYYILNAISKICAGFLFTINGYLPMICSLIVLIIVSIISTKFIEPVKGKKMTINEALGRKQLKEIKYGFAYILKSERLKALILCSSLLASLLAIMQTYTVSLLEELALTATVIGIISAIGSLISAYASKIQETFHKRLRNKSLITIAMTLSINCLISGICGIKAKESGFLLIIVIIGNLIYNFCYGMYYTIIEKYLRNFSNKHIDTKIFSANSLFGSVAKVIGGFLAAFLLDKTTTANCMIIIGTLFTILYMLTKTYMQERVGLKPEQYSEEETKYDELKQIEGKI